MENVWNEALLPPLEMRAFIDAVGSENVGVYFNVGNVLKFSYPEQWIHMLGKRIKVIHFKDFRRKVNIMEGFVNLLKGDMNFAAILQDLSTIEYDGWIFAEIWPPYPAQPTV